MKSRKENQCIKQLNFVCIDKWAFLKIPKFIEKPPFSSSLAQQLQEPLGISPVSPAETFLLSFCRGLPSWAQVLRLKDVLFLPSAAQDGLRPTLSAPCEQEKALFVRALKALHCGYLILFRINIGGDFRWLRFVERPLCSAALSDCRAPWEAAGRCKLCCLSLLPWFCFPRRLGCREMGLWLWAARKDRKSGCMVLKTAKILFSSHWPPEHDEMVELIHQHSRRNHNTSVSVSKYAGQGTKAR